MHLAFFAIDLVSVWNPAIKAAEVESGPNTCNSNTLFGRGMVSADIGESGDEPSEFERLAFKLSTAMVLWLRNLVTSGSSGTCMLESAGIIISSES